MLLGALLVATGCFSTLLSKSIGMERAVGLDGEREVCSGRIFKKCWIEQEARSLSNPFIQVLFMFLGMALCLPINKLFFQSSPSIKGRRTLAEPPTRWAHVWFAIPSTFDIFATALVMSGMPLVTISTYEMLRGSIVLYTSLLSYLFMQQTLSRKKLLGLALVISGVVSAGAVGGGGGEHTAAETFLGSSLLLLGFFLVAVMLVSETYFVSKLSVPPLDAVGWQGIWGTVTTLAVLGVLQASPGGNYGSVMSAHDSMLQMSNSPSLLLRLVLSGCSMGASNGFGATLSSQWSASHRTMLDTSRSVVLWMLSVGLGWETFTWVKVPGMLLIALGNAIYHDVVSFGVGGAVKSSPVKPPQDKSALASIGTSNGTRVRGRSPAKGKSPARGKSPGRRSSKGGA